jgi:hypothetical protein
VVLLLETALKKSVKDNEEKRNLQAAIDEVKEVTRECDSRVGEESKKVELRALSTRLKLRPEMQQIDLHLDHLGRELIFEGDLLRTSGGGIGGLTKFTSSHAILFDHYLVLAKMATQKTAEGIVRSDQYDVSRAVSIYISHLRR